MKAKRLFALLIATLIVLSALPVATLLTSALDVGSKIKEVALTITEPKAGDMVNLDCSAVEAKHFMTYKVIGVNWYKNHETNRMGVDSGTDNYFIGGESYTVGIYLAYKAGNSGWNFEYDGTNTDYSGITATINGKPATVTYHDINPDSKTIFVKYTYNNIAQGVITPWVYVPTPIAGELAPTHSQLKVLDDRTSQIESTEYFWYVNDGSANDRGEGWRKMGPAEKFVAGMNYKVTLFTSPKAGFKFDMSNITEKGGEGYIQGRVNGKLVDMQLDKYAGQYLDRGVTVDYIFESCEAQIIDSVSFTGITAPTEGQHPVYTAPVMGDSSYSLVTDEDINGGAEYGFVDGISWSHVGNHLTAQSTFEKGKIYVANFIIKADAAYRFADWVEATANIGYVQVTPIFGEPTLANVTVEFAPCDGGVLTDIAIGGVTEPVKGQTPDYDFIYSQGFGKGNVEDDIIWFDNTAGKALEPTDTFEYGHSYELRMILASDKQLNGNEGKFEFAPHGSLKVKVNGKPVNSISIYNTNPEANFVEIAIGMECAKAPIALVEVDVDEPLEGNLPPEKVTIDDGVPYFVMGFMFADAETGVELGSEDVFEAGKIYSFTVIFGAKEGYCFNESTLADVNSAGGGLQMTESLLRVTTTFTANELPYYFVSFHAGEGGSGSMEEIKVKGGTITLPECEFDAPDGKEFAGWTVDGINLVAGEYTVTEGVSFTAIYTDIGTHIHVYSDEYSRTDETFHYRNCISENCNGGGEIAEMHDWGNNTACDTKCTKCNYERTTDQAGDPLHFYEAACSEVCPNCGLKRKTTHTPGAAADCTNAQTCTVCNKVLAQALGHTPGEAATCGKAQTCTVCAAVIAEATGAHTPGAAATCGTAQKCTVCDAVLAEATGAHTPGAEATCGAAQTCTVCNAELAPKNDTHTPGAEATCTEAQKCSVCGAELKPANGHTPGVEWITNEGGHYKLCACGEKVEIGAHLDSDGDKVCDACAYDMSTGLPAGAIVGIVIGAVVLLGGGGFCVYWFVIRKKKLIK